MSGPPPALYIDISQLSAHRPASRLKKNSIHLCVNEKPKAPCNDNHFLCKKKAGGIPQSKD